MNLSHLLHAILFPLLLLFVVFNAKLLDASDLSSKLTDIENRINNFKPDLRYKDDSYGIIVVRDAIRSLKEGSGGIGACLVNEKTRKIVARGRNRQYSPYFRSDMHAEMDLLTRYENWLRKKGGTSSGNNPRICKDLVLISSVEPCPMCLTRIINSGIKKMYYISPDPDGGMVTRMDCMPPFWKDLASDRDFRQASCSLELKKITEDLFSYSMRVWRKKKGKKND